MPCRDINSDAQAVLHQVITLLLRLLRPARVYADIGAHGTTKLTAYFNLLSYCMVSKTEKLMASLIGHVLGGSFNVYVFVYR